MTHLYEHVPPASGMGTTEKSVVHPPLKSLVTVTEVTGGSAVKDRGKNYSSS